ncbi:MAG: lipopolysaccharide heptosyltransferase I [Burkholderiaceae bacterium]
MTRVLLIKTSSMGDIVHNLPVVADIRRALPSATIDWVVEEGYADLVRMARGVTRVIPIATRRWRHEPHRSKTRAERRAFLDALRSERYDVVLDTQGLLKSALVAGRARLAAGGVRVGFSFALVRESLARLFYDRGYGVDPRLHAIERMRALAASALDYPRPTDLPRFELDVPFQRFAWLEQPEDAGGRKRYAVLLHATARAEKAWPPDRWVILIGALCAAGITPVLPSGNERERTAAETIARDAAIAMGTSTCRPVVAPPLSLPAAAALLGGAAAVVGVDTGLLHIAAALDVPTVGLFGATPRWRYAPYWSPKAINLGGFGELGAQPAVSDVVGALESLGVLGDAEPPLAAIGDRA